MTTPHAPSWGVLGTGTVARLAMLPTLSNLSEGRLLAVASQDAGRAAACAAQFGIPRAYGSYQALLDDPDITCVYLALPNHLHCEWTIRAAAAGKHILCEKPLACTVAEVDQMYAACAASGVTLMEALWYRFHPRLARLQALLTAGAIGSVQHVQAAFCFTLQNRANYRTSGASPQSPLPSQAGGTVPFTRDERKLGERFRLRGTNGSWANGEREANAPRTDESGRSPYRLNPEKGGGALFDVGGYCVHAVRFIMGGEPLAVQAQAHYGPTGIDETTTGLLEFSGGRAAQILCSFEAAEYQRITIVCHQGVVDIPLAFTAWHSDPAPLLLHRGQETEVLPGAPADPYRIMAEEFTAAVLHNKPPPYPIAETRATIQVLEALARAARTGERQTLCAAPGP